MESKLVTVWRITLLKADVDEAIKTYIEAYHAPLPLSELAKRLLIAGIVGEGLRPGKKLVARE